MIEHSFLQFLAAQVPSFDFGLGNENIGYYFQSAPQEVDPPFVVFHLTGQNQDYPQASSGITYNNYDLDAFAIRPDDAARLSDAIKTAINGYQGDMFGYQCTLLRSEFGFDSEESDTNLFYRNINVQLNYI
jgi:hypothetical protein